MPLEPPSSADPGPALPATSRETIQRFAAILQRGRFWMSLIAWVLIIGGIVDVFTVVGILYAWIPIWAGIVLLMAGGDIGMAASTGEVVDFTRALERLRLYFKIMGITFLVLIVLVLVGFVLFSSYLAYFMAMSRGVMHP